MKSGYAKIEITPDRPAPLAGYFQISDRLPTHIRDPLYVRSIFLADGKSEIALISVDTLTITGELYRAVADRIASHISLLICATHTHSGFGGYSAGPISRAAFGSRRDWVIDFLADRIAEAIGKSRADLADCRSDCGSSRIAHLAKNRRDPGGAVDSELSLISFLRADDQLVILSYPGHPVIVAERDYRAISADFPGDICRRLESDRVKPLFVNGALGGVDVFFPESDIGADENLQLQSAPIVEAAELILGKLDRRGVEIKFDRRQLSLDRARPQLFFDDQPLWRAVARPLEKILGVMLSKETEGDVSLSALRVGDGLVVGIPAEPGVGVTAPIKEHARARGAKTVIVASHANSYIGYVHHPGDYRRRPPAGYRQMAIYENALNIFGRETGEILINEANEMIDELFPTEPG